MVKDWLLGGLIGLSTGLSFNLVVDALTPDLMLNFWEFGIACITPVVIAIAIALVTHSSVKKFLAIAFLTLLIPVFGTSIGASGSEPLWQFGAIGLVGGLVWATLFALCQFFNKKMNNKNS